MTVYDADVERRRRSRTMSYNRHLEQAMALNKFEQTEQQLNNNEPTPKNRRSLSTDNWYRGLNGASSTVYSLPSQAESFKMIISLFSALGHE